MPQPSLSPERAKVAKFYSAVDSYFAVLTHYRLGLGAKLKIIGFSRAIKYGIVWQVTMRFCQNTCSVDLLGGNIEDDRLASCRTLT